MIEVLVQSCFAFACVSHNSYSPSYLLILVYLMLSIHTKCGMKIGDTITSLENQHNMGVFQ